MWPNEVRQLALRAATAAKETQELIEKTVNSVNVGSKMTEDVQKNVIENIQISQKVGLLVNEIAMASNEQAQGIEQVNIAMTQMEQITQTVAANAEESASASEELLSQAMELKNMVKILDRHCRGSSFKLST